MIYRRTLTLAALALALPTLAGCPATPFVPPTPPAGNKQPLIQVFDASPKTGITKNDAITFTTVATDPEGQPLQYVWTSTKGTLSGNTGQAVSWKPIKADGSFEPGLATVTVIITDGTMTTTANVNIMIDAEGKVAPDALTIIKPDANGNIPVTPANSANPAVTPVPSRASQPPASPSMAPSPTSNFSGTTVNGSLYDSNGQLFNGDLTVRIVSLNPSVPYEAMVAANGGKYIVENVPTGVQIEVSVKSNGQVLRKRVEALLPNTPRSINFGGGATSSDPDGASFALGSSTTSTPTPTPTSTPAPTATLAPIPVSQVLVHEGFEAGASKWEVQSFYKQDGYSAQVKLGGAPEGNAALVFANDDGVIPAGASAKGVLTYNTRLDLSETVMPRVRITFKGAGNPSSTAITAFEWNTAYSGPNILEASGQVQTIGTGKGYADWTVKDFDLSSFKSTPGNMRLNFSVTSSNMATFNGLMVDDITIYDAGK